MYHIVHGLRCAVCNYQPIRPHRIAQHVSPHFQFSLWAGRLAAINDSNPFEVLRTAWSTKITRFRPFLQEAGPGHRLLPVPMFASGRWHPDAHRSVLGLIGAIASRSMVAFEMATDILFRRHAALWNTSNATCVLSGC